LPTWEGESSFIGGGDFELSVVRDMLLFRLIEGRRKGKRVPIFSRKEKERAAVGDDEERSSTLLLGKEKGYGLSY